MEMLIHTLDNALRTVFAKHHSQRAYPAHGIQTLHLSDDERREAGALMRVNHVGEVCAQALYASQALATRDPQLKAHFKHASDEETDHLAWTEARMADLGAQPSVLNPLWGLWWKPNAKLRRICKNTCSDCHWLTWLHARWWIR